MSDYWFFLSYARRDGLNNPYLERFYNDLALAVGRAAALESALQVSDIGFFDRQGIETGDIWRDTLTEAIQTSRVFVCLFSRSYFNSQFCGKEFQSFRARLEAYTRNFQKSQRPSLILPVLWDNPLKLPKTPQAVSEIQYAHDEFGKMYAQEGLNLLMRQQQYQGDYETFVLKFADKIVEEALKYADEKQVHLVPRLPNFPSLEQVENAFAPPPPLPSLPGEPQVSVDDEYVGPGVAKFIYVASRAAELQSQKIRKDLDCYGVQGGPLWCPYHPDQNAVGLIASKAAIEVNSQPHIIPLGKDLIERLRKAEETNTVVLILVDPWSARLQTYRERMEELDEEAFVNCGILIPWNENDDRIEPDFLAAKNNIKQLFSRTFVLNSKYIKDSISTPQQLESELIHAINEARRRIRQRQDVLRPAPGGPMPTITNG
jgi:FxsC-like protein